MNLHFFSLQVKGTRFQAGFNKDMGDSVPVIALGDWKGCQTVNPSLPLGVDFSPRPFWFKDEGGYLEPNKEAKKYA